MCIHKDKSFTTVQPDLLMLNYFGSCIDFQEKMVEISSEFVSRQISYM